MNLRRLEDTDLKQYFVILSLLLREFKKGETFASLLNIHDGDFRVVLTHLVCWVSLFFVLVCFNLSVFCFFLVLSLLFGFVTYPPIEKFE